MKWVSALSRQTDIDSAIQEAAESVIRQLGKDNADLTIVFVSQQFKEFYDKVPELISRYIKPGLLFGCSGGGIIGDGEEAEQQAALSITCAELPGVKIQPLQFETTDLPDQDTAPSVWRDWFGVDVKENPHFVFLADPFSFQAEEFLAGMDFAYPNSKKVGGLASGAQAPGGNAMYLEDKIYKTGLVGIALSGDIEVDTIVAQGCRPIGEPMQITKCDQTLLQELDGKPPLEILHDLNEILSDSDKKLLQTSLFLGIEMDPMKDNPKQGDFLIRNLMGIDRESGGLSIGALLRNGQLVQFHLRDKNMSAEDLEVMLTRYLSQGNAENAQGALLFSCLGRGQYLYGEANHDTNMFRGKLGNIPLGGFFCNGEIGPVGNATFLHGYTSSFGIFRKPHSH